MTANIDHETAGQKIINRLTAIIRIETLAKKIYRSSFLLDIVSGKH